MNKLLQVLLSSVVSLIVVAITPFSHVSAMQSSTMNHSGMSSNMSEHCTMLCQNADAKKENELKDVESEDDDEPTPPYYLQFKSVNSDLFVEKSIVPTSQVIHTPEKVPKYRLCCVVRR